MVPGALLNSKLTMTEHVTAILSTCSYSTYALRLLRSHRLQPHELHLVARAATVASILYVAPAWWGFAGEGDRHRLERLVARMRRSGYLPPDFPDLATLVEDADTKLFNSIRRNSTHVLRHYLVDKPSPSPFPPCKGPRFRSSTYTPIVTTGTMYQEHYMRRSAPPTVSA